MKKTLCLFALTLVLALACCGPALAAEYPLATAPETYSYPSGSTQVERTALTVDPASFTAALAQAKPEDQLIIDLATADQYYTVMIRADLLQAAVSQGISVVVRQQTTNAFYARTIPAVGDQAAAIYPGTALSDITVYYAVRWGETTDFETERDAAERQALTAANIQLDAGCPLQTVSVRLVKDGEMKALNTSGSFTYNIYTETEPDHTLQMFALDNNGAIRRVQDVIRQVTMNGQTWYRHSWAFTGSHVEARGLMGDMPAVPGLAGSWAEEHYQNNYCYGHFLNLSQGPLELLPADLLTREHMMTDILNLFAIQQPGPDETALLATVNIPAYLQQRLSKIDQSTGAGLASFSLTLTYERLFGPSEQQLAAYPEQYRVIVPGEELPRLTPVTALYRYVSDQIFSESISETEAGQLLAGFKDTAQLTGETKLAFAYGVKHGWITGDDSYCLRPFDAMTNAEFVTLMDRVGHDVGSYSVYGEPYLAKD